MSRGKHGTHGMAWLAGTGWKGKRGGRGGKEKGGDGRRNISERAPWGLKDRKGSYESACGGQQLHNDAVLFAEELVDNMR